MRGAILWTSLMCLLIGFSVLHAQEIDTTKLDHRITKEPRYESKSRFYCLLLFGPEGKSKVWMVLNGDKLYVDRNGNGDLTDPGECVTRKPEDHFFRVPNLSIGGAKTKYSDLRVNWRPDGGVGGNGKLHLHAIVRVNEHDQYAIVPATAQTPVKATLLHFDGPLQPHFRVEAFKRQEHFTRGKEHVLAVWLATSYPGVESVQVCHEKGIPTDVHPVVEVVFPAKSPDSKPTTIKVQLKHRC